MNNIITRLLSLADELDKKKQFEEANKIDKLLLPKKIDSVIPLGYQPRSDYETIQQLMFV